MSRKAFCVAAAVFWTLSWMGHARAFWVWTPESRRWVNPKYAVKETPAEQLDFARSFFMAGDHTRAIREFRKLIDAYPLSREAAEAQYFLGRSLEAQGRPMEAFRAYQTVVERYPFSDRLPDVVERQFAIGTALMEGKIRRNGLIQSLRGGDYDVVEIFRTVIRNAPYGPHAAEAQYKIGLYLQEKRLYVEARDAFEKTISDYPDTPWAKAARYQVALADARRSSDAQYDQKVTEAAVEQFREFIQDYPEADLSEKAKAEIRRLREKEAENQFLAARFYEKQKKVSAAKIYYHTIVEEYKDTSWAAKALERLQELNRGGG